MHHAFPGIVAQSDVLACFAEMGGVFGLVS